MILTVPLYAGDGLAIDSLRQLGVGGVGIAKPTGFEALLSNPAALAEAKSGINLSGLRLEANNKTLADQQKLLDLIAAKTTSARLDKIADMVPLTVGGKVMLDPSLAMIGPGFGLGVFALGDVFVTAKNPVVPVVAISGKFDLAPVVALARPVTLFGQDLLVGASLRYIVRTRVMDPSTGDPVEERHASDFLDTTSGFKVDTTSLAGISGDLGLLMAFGDAHLGMVLYNVGTPLSGTTSSGNAVKETLPMFVGVGWVQPVDLPVLGKMDLAGDLKLKHSDLYKDVFLGVEKALFGGGVTLQAGLRQGYPTVGIGLQIFIVHFQYVYYTEELGAKIGDNPQSYHGLEINLAF